MADNAGNPDDRASWLRLAASWLSMLKNEPRRVFGHPDGHEKQPDEPLWPKTSRKVSQASH